LRYCSPSLINYKAWIDVKGDPNKDIKLILKDDNLIFISEGRKGV